MLEGSFFHFPSLEMKMILSSFSPKHPKGELDHVWDIQPNVFVAESPSQHTTGNQHHPVLFAMWTDFNLDALRTLIFFFFNQTLLCCPVGKWRYSHLSFSLAWPLSAVHALWALMLQGPVLYLCVTVPRVWVIRGREDISGVITWNICTKTKIGPTWFGVHFDAVNVSFFHPDSRSCIIEARHWELSQDSHSLSFPWMTRLDNLIW